MKYTLLAVLAVAMLACGGSENKNTENTTSAPSQEEIAQEPAQTQVQENGKELIASSDCVACHKDNEKVIGPAYMDVANKYPENDTIVAYLAGKIIKGGAGNWGNVPMSPHPQHSQQEAEAMARYILSMNN